MADLHAFFDRDVFIKLICCDIWEQTIVAFEITHPYRLASATPDTAIRNLRKRGFSQDQLLALRPRFDKLCKEVPIVPEQWASDAMASKEFNAVNAVVGIDAGEAQLTALALTCPAENRLLTGDKRFVNALRAECAPQAKALGSRLITFEQCLLKVLEGCHFKELKQKLLPVRQCDGTLKLATGSGEETTVDAFVAAVSAYSA